MSRELVAVSLHAPRVFEPVKKVGILDPRYMVQAASRTMRPDCDGRHSHAAALRDMNCYYS